MQRVSVTLQVTVKLLSHADAELTNIASFLGLPQIYFPQLLEVVWCVQQLAMSRKPGLDLQDSNEFSREETLDKKRMTS